MIMIIEPIMANGMQIAHVDDAYNSVDWILDYPENIEKWKIRMFATFQIKQIITK